MSHRTQVFRIALRIAVVALVVVLAIVVLHSTLVASLIGGVTVMAVMIDALLHTRLDEPTVSPPNDKLTVDLRRRS